MEELIVQIATWIPDLEAFRLDLLGELLLAAFLGGVIGWERESKGKPAGLRTQMLICIGSTLLTELSIAFAELTVSDLVRADPARITAQIVSGIGFLGAGTIIQARGSVTGLTTAATLWVVAAIGIAVGSGAHVEATGTTLLVLVALLPLSWLEERLERQRRSRLVRLTMVQRPGAMDELQAWIEGHGVRASFDAADRDVARGRLTVQFHVWGREEAVRRVRTALLEKGDFHAIHIETP